MKKTVVIHDVPKEDLIEVEKDLKSEGYNTTHYEEPDGQYTVIGTKNIS
ncbi:hypothetical protein [Methylomonas albis]|uniref:Uncharacterized protein n=1 Tax=Methylomonas albis TaxID=1854563 RepID=A0ABR9CYI8_9GAMM|nr:hypothetical protein [Methylomonas albis]MBD9355933.1 hypothetical protein [Methylomonas albis]